MERRFVLACLAGAVALSACGHLDSKSLAASPKTIPVDAKVSISRDSSGKLLFKYDAPYADADGNFDFAEGEAGKSSVTLSFTIVDDSGLGLRFRRDGRDAIWIVEKALLANSGSTSPAGPYEGKQFRDFRVSADGKTLTVFDENSDGVLYRYALRFDMGSEVIAHDPDVGNGNGGGHGG
ncbi:MAG: hypothetical protein ACKVS5_12080 [Parvularculaceae bacterium]